MYKLSMLILYILKNYGSDFVYTSAFTYLYLNLKHSSIKEKSALAMSSKVIEIKKKKEKENCKRRTS